MLRWHYDLFDSYALKWFALYKLEVTPLHVSRGNIPDQLGQRPRRSQTLQPGYVTITIAAPETLKSNNSLLVLH